MKAGEQALGQLMARAQAGDAAAYRAVLDASRLWLKRYFDRRIAPGQVDDLIQETLISIHAKRATYDPARPYLPWLAAIARYRWVDQLRRVYRAGEQEMVGDIGFDGFESDSVARISIDRLLAHLPAAQAEAIRLVKIEGLSIAEASAASRQSPSLVKVNIHRGLKKLARHIESE
ncbi:MULTISPECIES: sigma-70 family RNA polymerase sigma factor [unclassified Sphingomonas]|jgi:RNA polymerase sigma-70 factor (ECF subfamily)|uniref:sigma-70 family RNA polymerase sigma factor n=1 Tax=unclassified Sphingomonas TaxID=196159 RepID=UPI0008299F06|nr:MULTISPECIES: sigma-70 family RNA polymerase sigma factor [unclassified Sphingomonas]MCH4891596.1 sigma-70 family RNA polymerase sigma factor [Sphingomonas sp. SFZ2018-12]